MSVHPVATIVPHPMASQLVGGPVEVVSPIYEGMEVKYQSFGSVQVVQCNADGTYELDIPGVGVKTVSLDEFEYLVVSLEFKVDHVSYNALVKEDKKEALEIAYRKIIVNEVSFAEVPSSAVTVALHQSSTRTQGRWHGAVIGRVTLTPPQGTSPGNLHVALTSSAVLADRLTRATAETLGKPTTPQPGVAEAPHTVEINTITITLHRHPLPGPELYEMQPPFKCWYYNEDDPRAIVWGRDDLQCGQPSITPNTATAKGRCLWPFIIPCAIACLPCRAVC